MSLEQLKQRHSILHKVREIVMWGWSQNTSCQGPEHVHIDIIKSVAHLTDNKDVFLCILRYHCRCGLLQQYEQLLEDMVGPGEAREFLLDRTRMAKALTGDRNFSIFCEMGVRYPTLLAMNKETEGYKDGRELDPLGQFSRSVHPAATDRTDLLPHRPLPHREGRASVNLAGSGSGLRADRGAV
jgi:hypothetical protein